MSDLLKYCRYYRGEKKCPNKADFLFWDYERIWAENLISDDTFHEQLRNYVQSGLAEFQRDDGVPLSLKVFLFDRYCHWNSGAMIDAVEGFKDFYLHKYKR